MSNKSPKFLKPHNELTYTQRKSLGLPKVAPRNREPGEATSMTFGNCTTPRNYRTGDGDPFHQVVRPGAERAYGLPSKGLGA